MTRLVIHQPNFLPYLGFFDQIARADIYIAYDDVQFTKHEFQNRNFINSQNGKQPLTLAVRKKGKLGQLINEVELASDDWPRQVRNKLTNSYAKAPFFDQVMADIDPVLKQGAMKLSDVNIGLLRILFDRLGLAPEFRIGSDISVDYEDRVDRIFQLMDHVGADTFVTGTGALGYMDLTEFDRRGKRIEIVKFEPFPYETIHAEWLPYLSVIDYAMNCGWEYWGRTR